MSVELDNAVEMPTEVKPKKTRARRSKLKEATSVDKLIESLKFISVVQKKSGTVEQQFCAMTNHWLIANNGIVMAGTRIEENLFACPHTYQLLEALTKSGQEMNIAQLNQNTLSVKSEKFNALIPCVAFESLNLPQPDPKQVQVNNRIKEALGAVAPLATDGAEKAHNAAVLLKSGTTAATNNQGILECFHGFDLFGKEFMVPKAAAVAVAECEKELVALGCSQSSLTFHFADDSFIRTQLFAESFPNFEHLFNVQTNCWPLPDEFFKAIKVVKSFSPNGFVYFDNGVVKSKEIETEATTYRLEGLPDEMIFNAKLLLLVQHAMAKVDFDKGRNNVIFFGNNIRGILAAVTQTETYQAQINDEDEVEF